MGRRQLAGELNKSVEEPVAELREVVRFPIVPLTWREQRIEGRLPCGERLNAYMLSMGRPKLSNGIEKLLPVFWSARVTGRHDHHLFAVNLFRQEG